MAGIYTVRLLTFTGLLSLSACQSSSPRSFEFDTRITTDGYKLFQLAYPPSDVELRLLRADASARARGQPKVVTERRALSVLEQILANNGYCRQGYILLGRPGGETSNRLRGECREKADARDRKAFPDTIERW